MDSRRWSGWWGIVIGLVGVACTRDNPSFDDADTGQTEGSATVGPATTSTGPTGQDVGDTVDGGSMSGSDGLPGLCIEDADCSDGVFCNGPEGCGPDKPEADDFGCVPGSGDPCVEGAQCDEDANTCVTDCQLSPDADRDGVDAVECGGTDCNDSNPNVFPQAAEVCDGAHVDEDCNPRTFGSADEDGDGLVSSECCNEAAGVTGCGSDCDDGLPGHGLGDWAHCGACNSPCGVLQACADGCIAARRVFVSSVVRNGNLGGLAGADDLCQELADGANLGGTFQAFLIDDGNDITRLEQAAVPYVRLDGERVAADWMDLTDGTLLAAIVVDENRVLRDGDGDRAWTGIHEGAVMPNGHCTGWTAELGLCGVETCGAGGVVTAIDSTWSANEIPYECSLLFRLYCIEQPG